MGNGRAVLMIFALAGTMAAQQPAAEKKLSFEVVSIRRAAPSPFTGNRTTILNPRRIMMQNINLLWLTYFATVPQPVRYDRDRPYRTQRSIRSETRVCVSTTRRPANSCRAVLGIGDTRTMGFENRKSLGTVQACHDRKRRAPDRELNDETNRDDLSGNGSLYVHRFLCVRASLPWAFLRSM